jgi:hypothetical protein
MISAPTVEDIASAIRFQWGRIEHDYRREATRERHRAMLIEARLCPHSKSKMAQTANYCVVWQCQLCKLSIIRKR